MTKTNVNKRQLRTLQALIRKLEAWQNRTPLDNGENAEVARAKSALMSLESKLSEALEEV